MNIVAWANRVNRDDNVHVKFLAGKTQGDSVDEQDLQIAVTTLKERFVVGLTDQMEESFRRFFVAMGINESNKRRDKCIAQWLGSGAEKKNSNAHPEVSDMIIDFDCFSGRYFIIIHLSCRLGKGALRGMPLLGEMHLILGYSTTSKSCSMSKKK
jgi:hypothetical protein